MTKTQYILALKTIVQKWLPNLDLRRANSLNIIQKTISHDNKLLTLFSTMHCLFSCLPALCIVS